MKANLLVTLIFLLTSSLPAMKTPQEKASLERQITATDAQLDHLVYDLYGLTDQEIQIIYNTL